MKTKLKKPPLALRQQLDVFADLVGGTPWGLEKGKPTVYMPCAPNFETFFTFIDTVWPSGCGSYEEAAIDAERERHILGVQAFNEEQKEERDKYPRR